MVKRPGKGRLSRHFLSFPFPRGRLGDGRVVDAAAALLRGRDAPGGELRERAPRHLRHERAHFLGELDARLDVVGLRADDDDLGDLLPRHGEEREHVLDADLMRRDLVLEMLHDRVVLEAEDRARRRVPVDGVDDEQPPRARHELRELDAKRAAVDDLHALREVVVRREIFRDAHMLQHSLCAISFSWCGKIRSSPPA